VEADATFPGRAGGIPEAPQVTEVSDGVFAYVQPDGSWYLNNTGVVAGSDGVISIDTCSTERRTRAYRRRARRHMG
jgi:cyclase